MESSTLYRHPLTILLTLLISSHYIISPTAPQPLAAADAAALRQIMYSLTDVKNGAFFSTWNFTSPEKDNQDNPCYTFSGVSCAVVDGQLRVVSLWLGNGLSDSPGLAGAISSDGIYALTELTQLILYPGIVTGFIPSEIGNRLKNLRVVSLTNNRLAGEIPASIFKLRHLHTLDLSHNFLTGVIPASLASSSTELRVLILAYNNLAGEIPNFSGESGLIHLDLRNNLLTGGLPEVLPATVRYLSLSSNGLWGPINSVPSSNLVYLDLSMNKFNGPIPDSLFRSSLTSMYLQRNNFSGEIVTPPETSIASAIAPAGPGSIIDLSHNSLSGEIPKFLDGVETLFLNNNLFTGTVPEGYVRNVMAGKMRTLYLQRNYLTGFAMQKGVVLPEGVALCLSYNCMVPPVVGVTACPASAGGPVSRPVRQCEVVKSGGNSMG